MKKIHRSIALAVALALLSTVLCGCGGKQPAPAQPAVETTAAETTAVPETAAETEAPTEAVVMETTAATEPPAVETEEVIEDFESVTIEGEGSVTLKRKGHCVDFSLPSEIKHYNRLSQYEPAVAMMTHDVFAGASGRTIVELLDETPEGYLSYRGFDSTQAQSVNVGGREGLLIVDKGDGEAVINGEAGSTDNTVHNEKYVYATDLGGVVLGFCVEVSYKNGKTIDINDTIIEILLSHCTIS